MGSRRARRQLAQIYISIAEEAQAERGKGRSRPVPERSWAGQASVGSLGQRLWESRSIGSLRHPWPGALI